MNQHNNVGSRTYQGKLTNDKLSTLLSTQQPCFFDLPHLGAIQIAGDKALEFLQGQVTCDMRSVTPQTMRQGALCNLKGRILALLDIIQYQEKYWLILPKDLINLTIHSLEKVALLSRVQLSCVSEAQLTGMWMPAAVNNPHSNSVMPTIPECTHYTTHSGHTMLFSHQLSKPLSTALQQQYPEGIQYDEIYWHYLQLAQGYISIYPETRGLFLPHALNLPTLGFIDFQKGCYKGQEIIARMHYRGTQLKHRIQFTHLTLPHTTPILGEAPCNPDNPQNTLGEIRPLRKIAEESVLREESERRPGVYMLVHEDSSTTSTKQDASSVEFLKRSIVDYCPLENPHEYLLASC